MLESLGYKVFVVDGEYKNIKLTTKDDLYLIKSYLEN